jgi:hypothetical protein
VEKVGQEFKGNTYINTELGPWGVWIYCDDNINLPEVTDTNARLCFKTHDLRKLHSTLSESGAKISNIYQGPFEHDYFDFWVPFDGFRLTVEEDPLVENEELSNDWIRLGVKDMDKAKEWYNRYIGLTVKSEHPQGKYAVMGMRSNFQDDFEIELM